MKVFLGAVIIGGLSLVGCGKSNQTEAPASPTAQASVAMQPAQAPATAPQPPNFSASYDIGMAAIGKKDYASALKAFEVSASKGHAASQYILGLMYKEGNGVPKDYKEAVKWSRLAADQGYADAQELLGMIYSIGMEGVPQDFKEAEKFYRLAAGQGKVDSQFFLASMYAKGEGVPKDEKESEKWIRLAARQGHARSQEILRRLGLTAESPETAPQTPTAAANDIITDSNEIERICGQIEGLTKGLAEVAASSFETSISNVRLIRAFVHPQLGCRLVFDTQRGPRECSIFGAVKTQNGEYLAHKGPMQQSLVCY